MKKVPVLGALVVALLLLTSGTRAKNTDVPPLGMPRYELVAEPEEGVRIYRSVGFEETCQLAINDLRGMAAGKSSSLSCVNEKEKTK